MGSKLTQAEALEGAVHWLRSRGMIETASARDPETFAQIRGFVLSEELRDRIGSNMLGLIAKARRRPRLSELTIRDAFLTASLGAIVNHDDPSLSEDELVMCAGIIMSLLPVAKLEWAGIAQKPLRSLLKSRSLVQKLQRLCASGG